MKNNKKIFLAYFVRIEGKPKRIDFVTKANSFYRRYKRRSMELIGGVLSGIESMVSRKNFEQTATTIASLNRSEITRRIKNFRGRFKLDFTEKYLNSLTTDRLRHILLAALIHAHN